MEEHQEDLGHAQAPAPIRWFPILLTAGAIAVAILAFWPRPRTPRNDQGSHHPAVGSEIRELVLQGLTGNSTDLQPEDWQGKVVFLNFWGPWCGPCGVEFPHLVQFEQQFHGREDFCFLSVSCSGGPGDERKMRTSTAQFLTQHEANFSALRDDDAVTRAHIMQAAGLGSVNHFAYPTTVILGRDGKIRGLWQGYADGDELAMLEVVQAALAEK
jgi:thiol-disulfide isomerase/thioredoxin